MCAIDSSTTASHANRPAARQRRLRRLLPCEEGSSSLELAFIAIFMFLFIAGIVDLGGAYQRYIVVINASREGARMYARLPCTSANRAALRSVVIDTAVGEAAASRVTLVKNNVTLTPDPGSACPASGSTVTVTVRDDYTPLMGSFWDATTFPIRASTSMMFY